MGSVSMKKWNIKKNSKEKWAATQETVFHVLSEKTGNEMLYSDLLEMVNNYFRFNLTGNAVGIMLGKHKKHGLIEVDIRMVDGYRQMYWKLNCDSKEEWMETVSVK